ncbi:SHOCT domain-containing protein [Rhizobium tubonense]|uniref:SHOCT domain-containing protein n=1 Tax=Rhizobium tubonense TaxID=484088 RepID=A0A2W4EX94_9HYPH|nr:SHOCT domain-containing protein [Rhizobium tubonense]PZM15123.1 hypothetical protein CPY51_08775 [Rhizobium tubonense]
MNILSEEGNRALKVIAQRHGVSQGAVEHLLMAIIAGQTTQAQFNHRELGGMGQWSQGGMIMVGDMFNNGLKAKISDICAELAALARNTELQAPTTSRQSQYQGNTASLFVPNVFSSGNWWPEELGYAASTGAQNDLRYAFFPASHRLAIRLGEGVTVYDTRDHQISGFSQQQSGDQSLTFTSQYGLVRLADLAVVSPAESEPETIQAVASTQPQVAPEFAPSTSHASVSTVSPEQGVPAEDDIFGKIERLAGLHSKGILTDLEFEAKKKELLDRL